MDSFTSSVSQCPSYIRFFFPQVCVWASKQRTSLVPFCIGNLRPFLAHQTLKALGHFNCGSSSLLLRWNQEQPSLRETPPSPSLGIVDKTMPYSPGFHLIAVLYLCDCLVRGIFTRWDRNQGSDWALFVKELFSSCTFWELLEKGPAPKTFWFGRTCPLKTPGPCSPISITEDN